MRSKNLPTNELGLNNEGKELAGIATKKYPHVPFPPRNWMASAAALTFRFLEPAIMSLDPVNREKSMS